MRITPIYSPNINNHRCYTKSRPSFTAHPDFYKYNSTMSCYFRRGCVALASNGYMDIENLFKTVFKNCENKIKNILIIGIGNSQEPFSYLASIKSILKEKKLKNNLALYTVDLQSKPSDKKIWEDAFYDGTYDYNYEPKFALDSFVKDKKFKKIEIPKENIDPIYEYLSMFEPKEEIKEEHLSYRVNDEILDFLKETYNNPEKSKWDSRLQDTVLEYPDGIFDIVSANNVLPYLLYNKDIADAIEQIKRTIKPNGYFITDPYEFPLGIQKFGVLKGLENIYKGIYRKI